MRNMAYDLWPMTACLWPSKACCSEKKIKMELCLPWNCAYSPLPHYFLNRRPEIITVFQPFLISYLSLAYEHCSHVFSER